MDWLCLLGKDERKFIRYVNSLDLRINSVANVRNSIPFLPKFLPQKFSYNFCIIIYIIKYFRFISSQMVLLYKIFINNIYSFTYFFSFCLIRKYKWKFLVTWYWSKFIVYMRFMSTCFCVFVIRCLRSGKITKDWVTN